MDLADILGKLIPATSQGDFCLQKIAKDKKLGNFFDIKLKSKKKQFIYFISKVNSKHPRMFKDIVRNILAESVEKRRTKGDPILRPEADSLKNKLLELDIDLGSEIDELNLPVTRPKITPPPILLSQSLERIGLHPLLIEKVLPLFKDGHINESVRKAGEIFEANITKWSGVRDKYGRDLVSQVFNKDKPIIDISRYHTGVIINPMDEKEGFMLVSMGMMQWCKNIVGHGDVDQISPSDAFSRIMLISHMLEVVDVSLKNNEEKSVGNSA
jgi:uncharacterized protein (TIGR02391 family)